MTHVRWLDIVSRLQRVSWELLDASAPSFDAPWPIGVSAAHCRPPTVAPFTKPVKIAALHNRGFIAKKKHRAQSRWRSERSSIRLQSVTEECHRSTSAGPARLSPGARAENPSRERWCIGCAGRGVSTASGRHHKGTVVSIDTTSRSVSALRHVYASLNLNAWALKVLFG
ncbi:unnamed protein product, partial [Iphiclides podalirius]